MGSVESAFLTQCTPSLTSYSSPDLPALLVLIQYLVQLEVRPLLRRFLLVFPGPLGVSEVPRVRISTEWPAIVRRLVAEKAHLTETLPRKDPGACLAERRLGTTTTMRVPGCESLRLHDRRDGCAGKEALGGGSSTDQLQEGGPDAPKR